MIEALAALAVASAGIAAIGSLLFSGSRSDLNTERHIALIATAQKISQACLRETSLPTANSAASSTIINGVSRLVRSRRLCSAGRWRGLGGAAHRLARPLPGGAIVDLDTVRLRRRAPQ